MEEVGFVKSVRNFLVYLDGLPTVKINDMVISENSVRGWVNALLPDKVEILLLDEGNVAPGQLFRRSDNKLIVPVGQFLLGRTINPLGIPIDGRGPLAKTNTDIFFELARPAPNINARSFIDRQFNTGIILVDTLLPLGCGQRELIIGDARSGKTDFLIDIIVNQKNTKTICIYASIGKPITEVRDLIDILSANRALAQTVIVATSSTDTAPLIFLTPQTAFSIAEYFQRQGFDVLVILDDMGNHAKIYREISLLSNKSPGRESYPGDIFYQHSHLLERAGNFKKEAGGGSITALPVIELNLNDFTSFIPTNLMAMTDGHLLFKAPLYNRGQRPAIDISASVSRVGRQTQNRIQNLLAIHIKQILTQAGQLESISRFSFELPAETQVVLKQKDLIEQLIQQSPLVFISKEIQTVLLALIFTSFAKEITPESIENCQEALIKEIASNPEMKPITEAVFKMADTSELYKKLESVAKILAKCIPQSQQIIEMPVASPQPNESKTEQTGVKTETEAKKANLNQS